MLHFSGTAVRLLAAELRTEKGEFVLDGAPRVRQRPTVEVVDGLQQLGADVTCLAETARPPVVVVEAKGRLARGKVRLVYVFISKCGLIPIPWAQHHKNRQVFQYK